jgi:pimeloyl-ACP methyl ester carboxylesterase
MSAKRILRRVAAALGVGAIVLAAGAYGAQALAQAANAEAFAIHDANGIDEEQFVPIGGVDQWVTIRGRNRANPVLLVVGGLGADGPGAVASPFLDAFQSWEGDFTVVQWDQRGAGKTFAKAGGKLDPDLGVDLLMRDALGLTGYLRERLHKRRIVLLGVGFGSTLAAKLVQTHPDLYSAYVAAGQIADPRAERQAAVGRQLLRLATAHNDQASLDDLKIAGPHPFADVPRDPAKLAAFGRVSGRYHARNPPHQDRDVLTAPHWSIADAMALRAGMTASEAKFGRAWDEGFDYPGLRADFAVPVFVVQGDLDIDAPEALSRAWLDRIHAPAKSFTVIPGAGTHALQTDPDSFLAVLRSQVRPWAMKGS